MYRSHTLLWAWLHGLASRAGFQTFSTEDTAENPRGFCSYNKIPPLLYPYPAFEPDSSRGCVRKSDLKILIFNGNLYTKRYRVCSKNQLLKHHVIVSCLLCGGPGINHATFTLFLAGSIYSHTCVFNLNIKVFLLAKRRRKRGMLLDVKLKRDYINRLSFQI